jgi:hypothetical protein
MMHVYKNDAAQLEGRQNPDDFLQKFITSDDEVRNRMLSCCDFGVPLGNQENDVPLYDQYNRGLALCQDDKPRTNLALEGTRAGLTGFIPSMEEAYKYPGTVPMGQKLLVSL